MDSISQFTLGAALGEAVLGKKIGNKAILIGGLAGTIPDLDIIFFPFLDDIQKLTLHRGISHALLFSFVIAPILAYLFFFLFKKHPEKPSYKEWVWLFFLGLFTHPILDTFTVYGTQLFLPFSDYRAGLNNIFIADPIYTLPFLLCLLTCLFINRKRKIRRFINHLGIGLSCLYICFTFGAKLYVNNVFEKSMQKQSIDYQRFMTGPMPLNSILWYAMAEVEDGYLYGLYSLLDKDKEIDFEFLERKGELLEGLEDNYAIDRLRWFSNDYFLVREKSKGELVFYDAKFGKADMRKGKEVFVFPFHIYFDDSNSQVRVEQDDRPPREEMKEQFSLLWNRILGKKD